MQQLIDGVHRFQTEEFGRYRRLFRRLSKDGQNPHTLFITCCDSRVLAELITQSQPGDLFVLKNICNIVPPAHVTASTTPTPPPPQSPLHPPHTPTTTLSSH